MDLKDLAVMLLQMYLSITSKNNIKLGRIQKLSVRLVSVRYLIAIMYFPGVRNANQLNVSSKNALMNNLMQKNSRLETFFISCFTVSSTMQNLVHVDCSLISFLKNISYWSL